MKGSGLLRIDVEMVINPRIAQIVEHFAANQDAFFRAFFIALGKLSTSGVLMTVKSINFMLHLDIEIISDYLS